MASDAQVVHHNDTHTGCLINCTQNVTWTEPNQDNVNYRYMDFYSRIYLTVCLVLILLVGVIGNVIVLLVIWKNKEMRNSTNIFIFSLSLADLLWLVSSLPYEVMYRYMHHFLNGSWWITYIKCLIMDYIETTAFDVASFTILAISVDRYMAICWPIATHGKLSTKRGIIVSVIIWIAVLILDIYVPVLNNVYQVQIPETNETVYQCASRQYVSIWMKVESFLPVALFYFGPLIIVTILYILVMRKLIRSRPMSSDSTESTNQYQERKKVVYMVGTITVLYFLLLFPCRLYVLIIRIYNLTDIFDFLGLELTINILFVVMILGYLNAAIDPIVYNVMSRQFRKGFWNLIHCRCKTSH